jgi:PKD repeat protein
LLLGCIDSGQGPSGRPAPPVSRGERDGPLEPIDLVYICGNKFLATNQTRGVVRVTYHVVGSDESGSLTLPPASIDDEGYSETEVETVERGAVELYQGEDLQSRRDNLGRACGPSPSSASLAEGATSASTGEWSPVFPWNDIAVHMSLLPTGKVLSWGFSDPPQLWDPATGQFSAVPAPAVIFCSGHSLLPDGRVLVSGGNNDANVVLNGIPNITIFDPVSQSWSGSAPMHYARWYPTNVAMPNGDVVIFSGKDGTGASVSYPEVWSNGATRVLTPLALPLYPRSFVAPNGKIFVAETATSRYLDATTGTWSLVAARLYGARSYGSAVMYEPGKVIYVGGGYTTNTAEIIDLNSPSPRWQWTGSMAFPRRHLNATVLPTGEVLATGGTGGTAFNDLTLAVHAAELWNPQTGVWTRLASNSIDRIYHSTSILLPDGRVLHAGSGESGPNQRNAELFSPPYLFQGPRPVISSAPDAVGYNTAFQVETPDAADISKVSLIRLGSATHAFDMGQRFEWLPFSRIPGGLSISAPDNSNLAPPGHYMLFLLNGSGVPSVAKIVKVGSAGDPQPPINAPPVASFTQDCTGYDCSFHDASTDADGQIASWSWSFGDGGAADVANPQHTYGAEGSFEVTLTITDDDGATNAVTHSVTVGSPPANTPPTAQFSQTCTGLSCSFTDGSTDGDGQVTGWSWDFGDGATSTQANPSHTYAGAGSYEVTLVATDDDQATATVSKSIGVTALPPNAPPTAQFSQTCTGLSCSFTDGSTDGDGQVTGWSWSFGDGGTATVKNPSHSYTAAGTYTVTLQATDDDGATNARSVSVTVNAPSSNVAPRAAFVALCTGLTCRFNDQSVDPDGTLASWKWTFGNGTSSTVRSLSKTYASAGTYTVTHSATDNRGAVGTSTAAITVATSGIVLNVTPKVDATRQYMMLAWTGARGTNVDVYRDGKFLKAEINDGRWTNSRLLPGASKYTYKICETGKTVCSNLATVQF